MGNVESGVMQGAEGGRFRDTIYPHQLHLESWSGSPISGRGPLEPRAIRYTSLRPVLSVYYGLY